MTTGETSISSNDNIQREIDVGRMSGVRDLSRRSSNLREEALNHPFLSESSWLRIVRSPSHERRWRLQRPRRRRRRWKFSNCFRCTSAVRDEDIPCSRDAPPTYSSIFADSLSHEFTFQASDQSVIVARIPPPTYTQAQGINLVEPSVDPFVSAANATSDWPRAPAAAICPRCSALIITAVVVRRSTITHLTALTLFLLGCWPCCMIPYCMDSCNNTDHYCPICRAYLGTNTPW